MVGFSRNERGYGDITVGFSRNERGYDDITVHLAVSF